jgi:hypothetical protein
MTQTTKQTSCLAWRKSTVSHGTNECVEVAAKGQSVLVRDSRDPSGPTLTFRAQEWITFLENVQHSTFDPRSWTH